VLAAAASHPIAVILIRISTSDLNQLGLVEPALRADVIMDSKNVFVLLHLDGRSLMLILGGNVLRLLVKFGLKMAVRASQPLAVRGGFRLKDSAAGLTEHKRTKIEAYL
jgi:hypothetical protein